uniref:Serpin domain-containing protein n=1 Tax=Panagrolaimus sp. ES5 TaxID=591445 RepID=A0AC34G2F2_9BILA
MTNAQADFTFNILRENGIDSSTILSPISIIIALSMAYLGAKENTAAEIRETIAKGIRENEIHPYFSTYLNDSKTFEFITLESANRIYFNQNLKLQDSYVDGIKKYYNGEFEQINFHQTSDAADKINQFVAKATHDKFQNITDPDSINPETSMFLINAIYFKAEWADKFWSFQTFETDFYSSPEKTTKVQMMSKETTFNIPYFENDEYEVLGLPYENHEATMFIILPRERFGLEKVMNEIDISVLIKNMAVSEKMEKEFYIKLPRFKIQSSIDLVEILKTFGIKNAFTEDANFSGISARQNMKISSFSHKALIETDENGSEATAVTQFHYIPLSGKFREPDTIVVDHPFLFIIADKKLNFLFAGTFFG